MVAKTRNGDPADQFVKTQAEQQPLGARPADGGVPQGQKREERKQKYTVLSEGAVFDFEKHNMGAVVELTEEEARRHTDGGVRLRLAGEEKDVDKNSPQRWRDQRDA